MKGWKDWLFVAGLIALVAGSIVFGARDIGHGKVSTAAAACFSVLLFLGGVLVGSYGRSKALFYALLACYGASFSLLEWFHRQDMMSLVLWMIFALIYAFSSWQTWKTQRLKTNIAAEP